MRYALLRWFKTLLLASLVEHYKLDYYNGSSLYVFLNIKIVDICTVLVILDPITAFFGEHKNLDYSDCTSLTLCHYRHNLLLKLLIANLHNHVLSGNQSPVLEPLLRACSSLWAFFITRECKYYAYTGEANQETSPRDIRLPSWRNTPSRFSFHANLCCMV